MPSLFGRQKCIFSWRCWFFEPKSKRNVISLKQCIDERKTIPTKTLNELILQIYDTVADQSLWPDVLDKCAHAVGAQSSAVFDQVGAPTSEIFTLSHSSNTYSQFGMDAYVDSFLEQELNDRGQAKLALSRSDGVEVLSDEVTYSDYAEFLDRDNVKYLRELGLRHRAISFLNKDNLNRTQFTLQFGDHRGPIRPDEAEQLATLLPHIAKALDLGRPIKKISEAHHGILLAMDQLTIGVCVLDEFGSAVAQNVEFVRQADQYGVFAIGSDGKLYFKTSANQLKFDQLRADALNNGKFGARPRKEAVATQTGGYLCIEVSPTHQIDELGTKPHAGAIVFSQDTSKPLDFDFNTVATCFRLSPAETKVARLLSQGLTNAEIAEKIDRSSETIKFHTKTILSKTQCSTRTQFVRLLGSFRNDTLG